MQIVRDPADAALIADAELRYLIENTIAALSPDGTYDSDVLGYFLIVQPGDNIATINAQIGFDILANKWTGIRFDQPGYTPSFEALEEHAGYYELVFVLGDDGAGVVVFVPMDADDDLLTLCRRYAQPAVSAVSAIAPESSQP
jgi:hypothetical protein